MIREAGKTWAEADADTCEAIDFCEYYARCARAVRAQEARHCSSASSTRSGTSPGRRGVISPWNFPCAIFTGMTAAALVTGNTVIAKPAEQTPGIAQSSATEMPVGGGHPRDVLHFCHARARRSARPRARPARQMIAFTGSKAVGLDIIEVRGATARPTGRPTSRRSSARWAARTPSSSTRRPTSTRRCWAFATVAFGFQGQKCSAAAGASSSTRRARRGGDDVHAAARRVDPLADHRRPARPRDGRRPGDRRGREGGDRGRIEQGKRECALELALEIPEGLEARTGRHYVGPHIFSGVTMDHSHRARGDLRARPQPLPRPLVRGGARDRQRERVQAHRGRVHPQAGAHRPREAGLPRRQPLHQPEVHRRGRRPPALRRRGHVAASAPRRAGRTTSSTSPTRGPAARTRCGAGSRPSSEPGPPGTAGHVWACLGAVTIRDPKENARRCRRACVGLVAGAGISPRAGRHCRRGGSPGREARRGCRTPG
jgi:hypothetical protein